MNHLSETNKNFIYSALIILILAPMYLIKLTNIPVNVTGDESIFIENALKIIYSPWVSPLELLGDKSMPALNFYFVALFIKIFSLDNTVFGLRFPTVIFALTTCITFYMFLNDYVKKEVSLIFTLLLGTNVLFLNFARSGWNNIWAICFGILLMYFFKKGLDNKKINYFILTGIFAALSFYTYMAGKIFIITVITYGFLYFLCNKQKRKLTIPYLIATSIFLVLSAPLIFNLFYNNQNEYLLRSSTVFILNNISSDKILITLTNQAIDNIKGLVLLDGSVIGKGLENLRYYPDKTSIVDLFVKISFFLGIIFNLKVQSKLIFWWILFILTIFLLGILTIDSPNLARTLPVLLFIYIQAALFWNKLVDLINPKYSYSILYIFSALIISYNVYTYFNWAQSPHTAQVRYPATEYANFKTWQDSKIDEIKILK